MNDKYSLYDKDNEKYVDDLCKKTILNMFRCENNDENNITYFSNMYKKIWNSDVGKKYIKKIFSSDNMLLIRNCGENILSHNEYKDKVKYLFCDYKTHAINDKFNDVSENE